MASSSGETAYTLDGRPAPGPLRPARVRNVHAHRGARTLTLSWSPVAGAVQYVIHVSGTHGKRELFVVPARTHHLRVATAAPGDRLSATIAARSRSGRLGPLTRAR